MSEDASKILLRSEVRTDFLGEYTAYIYGDGHVETDPPNRPVTKEDFQRRRAVDFAQRSAREALASARVAKATGRAGLNREQAGAAATAGVLDEMRRTMSAVSMMVSTTVAPEAALDELVYNVDMGGTLVVPGAATQSLSTGTTDEALRELR